MIKKKDDKKATQGPYMLGQERSGKSPDTKDTSRKFLECETCKTWFSPCSECPYCEAVEKIR